LNEMLVQTKNELEQTQQDLISVQASTEQIV